MTSQLWLTFINITRFTFFSVYLFYFTILYWFCHTLTWICHGCTCVPHPEPLSHLPPHPIPLGHPSAPAPGILSHALNLDWWFISHTIMYMFRWHSPKSSHPLPQNPKVHSTHLCLFCCLTFRLIIIILNSIYMHYYTVLVQNGSRVVKQNDFGIGPTWVSILALQVLVTQSYPTLCNPMDCSPLGSSVHGILQVRILEWVAMPFSRRSYQPRDQTQVSLIAGRLFTSWVPSITWLYQVNN